MKAKVVTIITLAALLGGVEAVFAAQIKETFHGKSGKTVYILEDIHGDYAVQKEHLQTLSILIQNETLRLIATEGSAGYLSSFPLQMESRASLSRLASGETLLRSSAINAAHLVQAVGGSSLTVVGVENRKAYERHLEIADQITANAGKVSEELKGCGAEWEKIFSLRVNRQTALGWKPGSLATQLKRDGIASPVLLEQARLVEAYYAAALSRDAILAENTLTRMDLEGETVCALIVGGFHTAGIAEILRENGVSYTVISPE